MVTLLPEDDRHAVDGLNSGAIQRNNGQQVAVDAPTPPSDETHTTTDEPSTQNPPPAMTAQRSSAPESTTTATSSPTASSASSISSSSSSCQTARHIVDGVEALPAHKKPATSSLTGDKTPTGTLNRSATAVALSTTWSTDGARPNQQHQRHRSTSDCTALGRNADDQSTDVMCATSAADDDDSTVELRVKPAADPSDGVTARPDIDQIRGFLETAYAPPSDALVAGLHQRDSFIHRSYNKKLLARKNAIDEMPKRKVAAEAPVATSAASKRFSEPPMPPPAAPPPLTSAALKRDSFLRSSFNTIRRSFSIRSSSSSKKNKSIDGCPPTTAASDTDRSSSIRQKNGRRKRDQSKASEAASVAASVNNNNAAGANGVYALSDGASDIGSVSGSVSETAASATTATSRFRHSNPLGAALRSFGHSRNSSTSSCTSQRSVQHGTAASSAPGTPTPHLGRSASPRPATDGKKEKKRKEPGSGRQKKFHRHFQQVNPDEHVINYFSCALVSDILLQGHLYITDNYFAFYSNVFGFVTKLLIPIVSVVKISKEKTAKIIPNAVGVATADERHVFGSFMSRESAYRLMLSVWLPVAPESEAGALQLRSTAGSGAESTASTHTSPVIRLPIGGAASAAHAAAAAAGLDASTKPFGRHNSSGNQSGTAAVAIDDRASGEFSVEDDSSSAISGNESSVAAFGIAVVPLGALAPSGLESLTTTTGASSTDAATTYGTRQRCTLTRTVDAIDGETKTAAPMTASAPPQQQRGQLAPAASVPAAAGQPRFYELEMPAQLMWCSYAVIAMLVLLSAYLIWHLWCVSVERPSLAHSGDELSAAIGANWNKIDPSNVDVYAEVLRWQRQMQAKGADEAQILLNTNLEQIAKVRKSLETLSILIHDTARDGETTGGILSESASSSSNVEARSSQLVGGSATPL